MSIPSVENTFKEEEEISLLGDVQLSKYLIVKKGAYITLSFSVHGYIDIEELDSLYKPEEEYEVQSTLEFLGFGQLFEAFRGILIHKFEF